MNIKSAAIDLSMKWNDYCKAFHTETLYVSNDGRTGLATISEGTGDNLLKEDEAEGYVDYWYMESYGDNEGDGGMYMTKELIWETDPTIGQILEDLADYDPALIPDGCCLLDPAEGCELDWVFYKAETRKMEERLKGSWNAFAETPEKGAEYELMVCYGDGGYVYFKTTAKTIEDAFKEYEKACKSAGLNTDNLRPSEMRLRDDRYNDIEVWKESEEKEKEDR